MSIFFDNFNRADSTSSVGSGWTNVVNGTGFSDGISTNRMFMRGNNSGNGGIFQNINATTGISLLYQFSDTTNFSMRDTDLWTLWGGALATPGYGVSIDNASVTGKVVIQDKLTALTSVVQSFNTSDVWAVQMDVTAAPQNWMYVYIWNTNGGSKPATATLKWENGQANYTPSAVGTNVGIEGDPNLTSIITMFAYQYNVRKYPEQAALTLLGTG